MKKILALIFIAASFQSEAQVNFYIDGQLVDQTQVQGAQLNDFTPDYSKVELKFENVSANTVDWTLNQCMLVDDPNVVGEDGQWTHENDQMGGIHFIFGPTASDPCWEMPVTMSTAIRLSSGEKAIFLQAFEVLGAGCETHRYYVMEGGQAIDSIEVIFCSTLGLKENSALNFSLAPNPAKEEFTIASDPSMRHVTVLNALGQVCFASEVNTEKVKCSVATWDAGVYIVRVAFDSGVATQKLVVE